MSKVETKRDILHLLLSNLKLQDRKISYTLWKPYDYIRSLNKKTPSKKEGVAIGDPNGWPQARMPLGILAKETQWDFLLRASDNAAKQQN